MRTEDRRRRPPPPASRRRDPVARLGPWLLIAVVIGAFIFGHFGARVGFQQIGPMALQTSKATTGQRLAVHGQSNTLAGPVRVIDGDTIVLTDTDTRIRLNGVDAPEVVHPGYDHDDPFGPQSRDEMRQIVGDKIVRCELNGERSYERLIGVCFLPDGTDVGAEIIRRGLALDCSHFSGSMYRTLEPAGVRAIIRQARYC
jgi:endonuclease YncB( thermonuclease family)